MKNFSKDAYAYNELDQNLYFAQNLPKRAPRNTEEVNTRTKVRKEPREFTLLMVLLKWILMVAIYPLHLIFKLLPLFLEKQARWLFQKVLFYIRQVTAYLHKTIWVPVARQVNKIIVFIMNPLKVFYYASKDWIQKQILRIKAFLNRYISAIKGVIEYIQMHIADLSDYILYVIKAYYRRVSDMVTEIYPGS